MVQFLGTTTGEDLVEMAFTYDQAEPKGKANTLKGTLFFDPHMYWCIRSGEIQRTGDIVSGTLKFHTKQVDSGGVLPPLSRQYDSDGEYVSTAGERNRKQIHQEVTLHQASPLPSDKEFTLSAFGLPEPPGLEQPVVRSWYLWAALAGVVCLVVAGLFGWLARRKRTISTGIPTVRP